MLNYQRVIPAMFYLTGTPPACERPAQDMSSGHLGAAAIPVFPVFPNGNAVFNNYPLVI